MNSSELYQSKRFILSFSEKLSLGLSKPKQRFIRDMLYGLSKSQTVILSDIARSLEEPSTFQTTKRLSRNASSFYPFHTLHDNYLKTLNKYLTKDMLVLVDSSDIVKPYGQQFEALGKVHDGSSGRLEKGYTTINFSIASPKTKHPIPIYSHLCSSQEEHFDSMNVETVKGINQTKRLFGELPYTLVMDRGYDSMKLYQLFIQQKQAFITRLCDKRYLWYQNKRLKVPDLAQRRKGKIAFQTSIQGKNYDLKISHVPVSLPSMKEEPLKMIVVYGYGKKPMKLLTNKSIRSKKDVLRIVKAYITRWRIEELFRVQKQEFQLEKVRTLSLTSLRLIYRLVNYLIGAYSLELETDTQLTARILAQARAHREANTVAFHLYRFIRGMTRLLAWDHSGLNSFIRKKQRSSVRQLELPL